MPKLDLTSAPFVSFAADDPLGAARRWAVGDAGGLTQFGVAIEELSAGAASSKRHWHSDEDELVYVLDGAITLVEDDGATSLKPGDAVAWPANRPNAHRLENHSTSTVRFLVVGKRSATDTVNYPDLGQTRVRAADGSWQLTGPGGTLIEEGGHANA
jgi:uncharacterized cupin superfamily protein